MWLAIATPYSYVYDMDAIVLKYCADVKEAIGSGYVAKAFAKLK